MDRRRSARMRRTAEVYATEGTVGTQAMPVEVLLSGFFVPACFNARAEHALPFVRFRRRETVEKLGHLVR